MSRRSGGLLGRLRRPEPVPVPAYVPRARPEPIIESEPAPVVEAPAPVVEPGPEPVVEPEPFVEPEPEPEPEPVVEAPTPVVEPEPEPVIEAEPVDAGPPPTQEIELYSPPPPEEPPFRGPLESALRHPWTVLLTLLVLFGASVAVGVLRKPGYLAKTRINVGRTDVPAYTLQGVLIGNATLAASYSRSIAAEPVIRAAARAAGVSDNHARAFLIASPVPESTLIEITAGSKRSATEAIALANGAAKGLVNYVTELNREPPRNDLLDLYTRALRSVDRAKREAARLGRTLPSTSPRVQAAQREAAAAQLRATTIGNQYQGASGEAATTNTPLRVIVSAVSAKSDRLQVAERVGFIGFVAGLLAGLGFALLRANRGIRRRLQR